MNHLTVREMTVADVDSLMDYWYNASKEFLAGMGADIDKLPFRADFHQMVSTQIELPYEDKKSYPLTWEINGIPAGHSNVNKIEFGVSAFMHLHLWQASTHRKGTGSQLLKKSLPFYFEKLKLQTLYCEPYALNPAPNKTLEKLGFTFVKKYHTIPGSFSDEQETNRWKMERNEYLLLK